MSRHKILATLLTASLAGNAAFLITTFSRRPPAHAGLVDQLALTEEQVASFAGSRQAFQDDRARAHQRMAELRSALGDELTKEIPDRPRLVAIAMDMAQIQTDMRPKLVDHLLGLHALLTPSQRATFAEAMRTGGGTAAACPGAMLYPTADERK